MYKHILGDSEDGDDDSRWIRLEGVRMSFLVDGGGGGTARFENMRRCHMLNE